MPAVRLTIEFEDGACVHYCAIDPAELRRYAFDLLDAATQAEDHAFILQFISRI